MVTNNFSPRGVWPTMITPFNHDKSIDYTGLGAIIDWYAAMGVDGLFAVCQSSEMFFLSPEEKLQLLEFVLKATRGRLPVVASGHTADDTDQQIAELKAMAALRPDAIVLISSRLAKEGEPDSVALRNLDRITTALPTDISLGMYECPYPYKRIVSHQLMKFMVDSKRFVFFKDTSCLHESMKQKLQLSKNSPLKIFDANAALLTKSLAAGAAGYCGVMANFHPQLYSYMIKNVAVQDEKTAALKNFLSLASAIEARAYPMCAKYYLSLEGLPITTVTRSKDESTLTESFRHEVEALHRLTKFFEETLCRI